MKNLDLTIYDKNAGVGGTWYSNKYPVRQIAPEDRNTLTMKITVGIGM